MSNIRHILIIEDSVGDQLLAKMTVVNAGLDIQISFASDGEEGLAVLESMTEKPELILLDINMPRMNGHEFLQCYAEKYESVPPIIVVLTSSDQVEDRRMALKYSCVKDYILKPLTQEKLSGLNKYLDMYDTESVD